jgi:hypothetical protein
MNTLTMPEGAEELIDARISAQEGKGYLAELKRTLLWSCFSPLIATLFAMFAWFYIMMTLDTWIDDPNLIDDVSSPMLAIFPGLIALILACYSLIYLLGAGASFLSALKMFSRKRYPHRRLPAEEDLLKDRLSLDAVALAEQVKVYNRLVTELELQREMHHAGLPSDIDIERASRLAQSLHADLSPKLRQLELLIKRRQLQDDNQEVDLVTMREMLGDRHRDLLAELKTQKELGGNAPESALHSALSYDSLNAELGDADAASRELKARRKKETQ